MVLGAAYQAVLMQAKAALDTRSGALWYMNEYALVFSGDHEQYCPGAAKRTIVSAGPNDGIIGTLKGFHILAVT